MNVDLVSYTTPALRLQDQGIKTGEDLIVYCARVSAPDNQLKTETGPRLLRYCIRKGHWSVFQQADMGIELETSRAIAAQILRHKFDVQEFSQRYAKATLGFEYYTARRQDEKDRQNSVDDMSESDKAWFLRAQEENNSGAWSFYEEALRRGIAKEQARFLLPLSTTTRMYLKYNVRGWIHYLQSRCAPETQKEHREPALIIRETMFKPLFPQVYQAVWGEQ